MLNFFQCFLSMKVKQIIYGFLTPLSLSFKDRRNNQDTQICWSTSCFQNKGRELPLTSASPDSSLQFNFSSALNDQFRLVICVSFLSQSADTLWKMKVKKDTLFWFLVKKETSAFQCHVGKSRSSARSKIFGLLSINRLEKWRFWVVLALLKFL